MSQTLTPILTLDDWIHSFVYQSELRTANKLDIMRYLSYDVDQDSTLADIDAALWRLHEAHSVHPFRGTWSYKACEATPSSGDDFRWGRGEEARKRMIAFRAQHFPTKNKTDHSDLEVEDWILTLLRAQELTRSWTNSHNSLFPHTGAAVSALAVMSAIQYQVGRDVTIAQFDSAVENLVEQRKIESMNPNRNCWRVILLDDVAQRRAFRIEDFPISDEV